MLIQWFSSHNVSVKLSPSLCSYSSYQFDWTNGCMCFLGEISSVLARLMMKYLPSMLPIIAHCNAQLTVVIVITNHLKGMGYRNGVWSTGGACVHYTRVIEHKGWNIPTYNSWGCWVYFDDNWLFKVNVHMLNLILQELCASWVSHILNK